MSQEEVFDAFYRETRGDVLLQAFLLTGDLTAATAAVKDAYAVTWQHRPQNGWVTRSTRPPLRRWAPTQLPVTGRERSNRPSRAR